MTPHPSEHPTEQEIERAFAPGALSAPELDALANHLAECPDCYALFGYAEGRLRAGANGSSGAPPRLRG